MKLYRRLLNIIIIYYDIIKIKNNYNSIFDAVKNYRCASEDLHNNINSMLKTGNMQNNDNYRYLIYFT